MAVAGKVALITGAARGIGLATTSLLLKGGARVSMLDVSVSEGRSECAHLQKRFPKESIMFMQANVTQEEELRAAFEATKEKFGGIDIVLNNAGIGDEDKWKEMVGVMEGTFLGLEYMSTATGGRGGTIINVSSFGGVVPMPFAPCYAASKHGVVGFTRSMKGKAKSDGVRINCICPEFADTRLVTEAMRSFNFIKSVGVLSTETVAEAILTLIEDTSKAGAVASVTKKHGYKYVKLFGDSSKL